MRVQVTVALEPVRSARGALEAGTAQGTPIFSPLSIAADRCKGCELCIGACLHHVLALDLGVVNPLGYHPIRLTDPGRCTSCGLCARVCPDAVLTVFAPRKEAGR